LIRNISVFLKRELGKREEGKKGDSLDLEFIARFILTAAVGTLVTHGIEMLIRRKGLLIYLLF